MDKDYVHEIHYENEDPYENLEFWIWHVCNLLQNISTVEPHWTFNGTTLKLKRDLKEETGHAYGNALRDALSAGGKDNITKDNCQGEFMDICMDIFHQLK